MCTNPIKIINPKLKAQLSTFNKEHDAAYIEVPCGQCISCQLQKNQEWLTRLSYEFEWNKMQKGQIHFQTFTYRPSAVPKLHGQMVFNTEHYKTFMKILRINLDRWYEAFKEKWLALGGVEDDIEDMNPRDSLKVFWVSEYGGEFKRPHYHALFFLTFKIPAETFRQLCEKSWSHGFIDRRPIEKIIVDDWAGVAYVAKYLCKDMEFIKSLTNQKNSKFKEYLRQVYPNLYGVPFEEQVFMEAPCETLKKILHDLHMEKAVPYFRVSRGFGEYGVTKLSDHDYETNTTVCRDTKKGFVKVNIPMYIMRKKLYDYDKITKSWNINEFGKRCKIMQSEESVHKVIINVDQAHEYFKMHKSEFEEKWNTEVVEKVWTDINLNKKRFNKLIHTLRWRWHIATQDLMEDLDKGDEGIMFWRTKLAYDYDNYKIDPYKNYLSTEPEYFLQGYVNTLNANTVEAVTRDEQIRYIIQVIDDINRIMNKKRAEFLYAKAVKMSNIKQIKK